MSFIKIGYGNNGQILHTICNGKPESAEFFFSGEDGRCIGVKNPIAIEFTQDNLQKILRVFKKED